MEWISVKDRLPSSLFAGQYKRYIVSDGKYVMEASWLFNKFCKRHDGCSDLTPTHWMPLPEPPKV